MCQVPTQPRGKVATSPAPPRSARRDWSDSNGPTLLPTIEVVDADLRAAARDGLDRVLAGLERYVDELNDGPALTERLRHDPPAWVDQEERSALSEASQQRVAAGAKQEREPLTGADALGGDRWPGGQYEL